MTFSDLLLFFLAVYGLTNIVVGSRLFKPLRDKFPKACEVDKDKVSVFSKRWLLGKLGYLLSCMMCFGFWAGLIVPILPKQIELALAGSAVCWILYVILQRLGENDL